MTILVSIVAVLLCIVGCIGCVVPIIPGVALTYGGYLCLYFIEGAEVSTAWVVTFGVLTLIISVLDYLLPACMTKRFGGTKAGERGAMAGVIAGMFFGPLGIIVAPFVGAMVAELIYDSSDKQRAFKSGLGSFLSFFVGTGLKLLLAVWMTFAAVGEIWTVLF